MVPVPVRPSGDGLPGPADAARRLAELQLHRTQVQTAARVGQRRWVLPLSVGIAFAQEAARSLTGPRAPWVRHSLSAVSIASTFISQPAAPVTLGYDFDPAQLDDDRDAELFENAFRLAHNPLPMLAVSIGIGVGSRRLTRLLRERERPHAWLLAATAVALLQVPAALVTRRTRQRVWEAQRARDVTDPAAARREDPPAALHPLLAGDPAAFSIVGLLAACDEATVDLLAAAIPLDRGVLADRLGALVRAGLVTVERRGRLRPRTWAQLTERGRGVARAHAAALRALATAPPARA